MKGDHPSLAYYTMEELLQEAHAPGLMHRFDKIKVDQHAYNCEYVINQLEEMLTQRRKSKISKVIANRTFQLTPVVEGLVNTGNVSAVMRTAEGMGFQPFHVINNGEKFKHSERISHGAEKWLSLWRWPDPATCTEFLRKQGYRIVVTVSSEAALSLTDLDFTKPTALVWGNEAHGVTNTMLAKADLTCYIPMNGFTESLNISVAAAVSLFHAYQHRLQKQGYQGDLTPEQETYLKALFYYRSVRNSDQILLKRGKTN